MPIVFYPHDEDIPVSLQDKLDTFLEAAERYKAAILDTKNIAPSSAENQSGADKRTTPKDMRIAFNWQEIAKILREIRELPENSTATKMLKADKLTKLAEIYEVLRAAKMPKLEAVRIALMNEANQLRAGGTTQIA